ncbi:MAG: hypothetical protein J6I60_08400 [Bacteroidaceae bacterium]|nr:hypothetical protein [Bacteroidaceae bacterium]
MENNILALLIGIGILLVVFLCIKRMASCLVKTIIMLVLAGALAFVYFNYIKEYKGDEQKPRIVKEVDQRFR